MKKIEFPIMVQLFSDIALLQLKWPNTLNSNASILAFERECTIRYSVFKLAMGKKVLDCTDPLNDHPKLRLLDPSTRVRSSKFC